MRSEGIYLRRRTIFISLFLALLAGGALVLVTLGASHSVFGATDGVTLRVAKDAAQSGSGRVSLTEGFAPIVKKNLPSVVNISSSRTVKTQASPFFNDPFFRQFFGPMFQAPREQREHSLGSGVIVSADGYILTNNHVVDDATDIKVALQDKREFKAKVIGKDAKTDIAVLKIDARDLPAITLGDSSNVQIGDFVLAIGNPFGLGETVTMGIVSATGRSGLGIEDYEDFIQTDAAINPGNSGGAMINVKGELVGINTAILTGGGHGNEGIGFAIPINMARQIMEQLLKHGKVVRGYLGVSIQEVTPGLAKAFRLPKPEGALVGDVEANTPAAKAGLQKGDIILVLNGQAVPDSRTLRLRVASLAPGTVVKLKILRDGKPLEKTVTLAELPGGSAQASSGPSTGNAMSGVQVDALTPDIAQQLDLPANTRGVVITAVDPGSAAADAGLQRGDVIEEVNREPVTNVDQYEAALRAAGNQQVLLLINRGGSTVFVVVSPQ